MGVLTESKHKPQNVLRFFEEICSIPHGSGNMEMISNYLVNFAKERGLKYRQDELKDVIIWKEGTEGYEDSDPVIIQGHMDMVAVKTDDCEKDMETEGLDLEILDNKWISAKGTSLGGDDGIAIAYALAILDSDTIPHPPLEIIITTDEETGMFGADFMDCSDIKGRLFINLDSEDEGIFTVSCAGGLCAVSSVPYTRENVKGTVLDIKIHGLKGGHSGVEINTGRLNANILLGRLLTAANTEDTHIINIGGGSKDNVIAPTSYVSVVVAPEQAYEFKQKFLEELELVKEEYKTVDPDVTATITEVEGQKVSAFSKKSTDAMIAILMNLPNGIQRMNPDMENMVQTSLNLGILKTNEEAVIMSCALRSSSESEKEFLLARVKSFINVFGGTVRVSGNYPGWEYRAESRLRDVCVNAYIEQYNEEPIVEGIHAGLECGLFSSKLDNLDCISFGPTMKDVHSVNERLNILSVKRTWELLQNILSELK